MLRKLLGAECVQLRHLVGQWKSVCETFGEEHDLCDEAIVGHHHCYWAEQRFEIVWQLSAASISRILNVYMLQASIEIIKTNTVMKRVYI